VHNFNEFLLYGVTKINRKKKKKKNLMSFCSTALKRSFNAAFYANGINLCRLFTSGTNYKVGTV
jgi:hypothetical protein